MPGEDFSKLSTEELERLLAEAEGRAPAGNLEALSDAELKQELARLESRPVLRTSERPDVSRTESTLRGAAQGATLGHSDEIAGALGAVLARERGTIGRAPQSLAERGPAQGRGSRAFIPDPEFDAARARLTEEARAANAAAREAHPVFYTGGEFVGGAAIPVPGLQGLTALQRAARLAGVGAATGAIAGEGYSDAPLLSGKTAARSLGGAATGAVLVPAVAEGIRRAAPRLRRTAENQGAKALGFLYSLLRQSTRDEARRVAREALDAGVISPLASSETMLARAEGAQARAGERLREIRAAVDETGIGEPVGPILAEQRRVLSDFTPGTGDAVPLGAHRDQVARDLIAQARTSGTRFPQQRGAADAPYRILRDQYTGRLLPGNATQAQFDEFARRTAEHRHSVAQALVEGKPVASEVLEDYPDLVEALFPRDISAEGLAVAKRYRAGKAYQNAQQVPETLGGTLGARDEAARAVLQEAEDRLIERVRPDLAEDFQRQKDIYGAMERLTNPRSGATEARASRDLGNNQVFNIPMIGGLVRGQDPVEASAIALAVRFAHQRGNQIVSVATDRLARLAESRAVDPTTRAAAQWLLAHPEILVQVEQLQQPEAR